MNFMQLIKRLEATEQAVRELLERVSALETRQSPEQYIPPPEKRGPGRPRKIDG